MPWRLLSSCTRIRAGLCRKALRYHSSVEHHSPSFPSGAGNGNVEESYVEDVIRQNVLGVLSLLASPSAQIHYVLSVGVPMPAEMLCQWADDVYRPDSDAFRRAFSPAE